MSSRLAKTFDALRAAGRTGLVTFVTAGDPDETRSEEILVALDRSGADVIELGIPFSDPLADGPVIQRASERALRRGTTLTSALAMLKRLRARLHAPVVLFTYANPLVRFGFEGFARAAAEAGVDGVLALDLPLEEAAPLQDALSCAGIDTIFLLSPTTDVTRIAEAARRGSGFLYVISRLGVTGARQSVAEGAQGLVARIRAVTSLPIALGFGLSRPEHIADVGRFADAAVVGSALVDVIARNADRPDLPARVEHYVRWLKGEGVGLEAADA